MPEAMDVLLFCIHVMAGWLPITVLQQSWAGGEAALPIPVAASFDLPVLANLTMVARFFDLCFVVTARFLKVLDCIVLPAPASMPRSTPLSAMVVLIPYSIMPFFAA